MTRRDEVTSLGPTPAEYDQSTAIAKQLLKAAGKKATMRVIILGAVRSVEALLCSQDFSRDDAMLVVDAFTNDLRKAVKDHFDEVSS